MPRHTVATLPETHRRAREILRKRWSRKVTEVSPVWTVRIDGKDSVIAAGAVDVVLVTPGFTGADFSAPTNRVGAPVDDTDVIVRGESGWGYRVRFDVPAELQDFCSVLGVDAAAARRRAEEASVHRSVVHDFLAVTIDSVPGAEIIEVHGDVVGVAVRARNIFSNLAAAGRGLIGGEAAGYTSLLIETRQQARARMIETAADMGANAVVGMRYDSTEIADLMSEVTAYGTAVTVRFPDTSQR